MATEKISLTDQLRNNIVTLRKELGISAYELFQKKAIILNTGFLT